MCFLEKFMRFVARITIGILFSFSLLTQLSHSNELNPADESHFRALDIAINKSDIDVYLVVNGDVDPRGRSCQKILPTGKFGSYKTNKSRVTLDGRKLHVHTPGSKANVVAESQSGHKSCVNDFNSYSIGASVIERKGIPVLFEYSLSESYCYLSAIYTNCKRRCIARARTGSSFYYIVMGKGVAESLSKTKCN